MTTPKVQQEPIRYELRSADQGGLRLVVQRSGKVFDTEIVLVGAPGITPRRLLRAVDVPCELTGCLAPRIQDLNDTELRRNQDAALADQAPALLVGIAEHLHWSLSITASGASEFDVDVAVRRGSSPFPESLAIVFEVAPGVAVTKSASDEGSVAAETVLTYRCQEAAGNYVGCSGRQLGSEWYLLADLSQVETERRTVQWRFQVGVTENEQPTEEKSV